MNLTEEQKKKIEENRLKALEKINAKRKQSDDSIPSSLNPFSTFTMTNNDSLKNYYNQNSSASTFTATTKSSSLPFQSFPSDPIKFKTATKSTLKSFNSSSTSNLPSSSFSSSLSSSSSFLNSSKNEKKLSIKLQLDSPLTFSSNDIPRLSGYFREIPQAKFYSSEKLWKFPLQEYKNFVSNLPKEKNIQLATRDEIPEIVLDIFLDNEILQDDYIDSSNSPSPMDSSPIDWSRIETILLESLFPFQKEGIEFAIKRNGRIILADDMGLGKSIQALGIASYYQSDWPLFIITPASMVASWHEQFLRWIPSISPSSICVAYDGKSLLTGLVNITSYDLAIRLIDIIKNRNFKTIICDESHALKNPESKRSTLLLPILKKSKRAILLSGTPALSRPVELYSQITAIKPKLFSKFSDFGKRYCNGHQGHFGWDWKGASNLRELQLVLEKTLMIRRIKGDVLGQLPRKIREQVFLRIAKADLKDLKKKSDALYSDSSDLYSDQSQHSGSIFDSMQNRAEFMDLWRRSSQVKLSAMIEYVQDLLEANHKMLVFAHHQFVLDGFEESFIEKKVSFVRIDGSTLPAARQKICNDFQQNPSIRVALLSITAACTGLTLTSATTVVFAELFWNPGIMCQAEDRAHRIGQTDTVIVQYLLAKDTCDDRIWPLILRKLNTLEGVGLVKNDFCEMQQRTHDPTQMILDKFIKKG